jgi:DNA polymerase-3 subunit epsilon
MTRKLIIVDTETNGLDPDRHIGVEVGWWDLSTGRRGGFIPIHNVRDTLATADIRALQLNRYIDRIATAPQDTRGEGAKELAWLLDGNTIVGANPGFDEWVLRKMYAALEPLEFFAPPEWHHRKWDIETYAAAVLGLDYLPGLAEICKILDVEMPDHTAFGDVTATGLCFMALAERAGMQRVLR